MRLRLLLCGKQRTVELRRRPSANFATLLLRHPAKRARSPLVGRKCSSLLNKKHPRLFFPIAIHSIPTVLLRFRCTVSSRFRERLRLCCRLLAVDLAVARCGCGLCAARMASARFLTSADASHPAAAISRSCACERSKRRAVNRETGLISTVVMKKFRQLSVVPRVAQLFIQGTRRADSGRTRRKPYIPAARRRQP